MTSRTVETTVETARRRSDRSNRKSVTNQQPVVVQQHVVELFTDLVLVVALHAAASPFESVVDLWSGKNNLPIYLMRIFLLWRLWKGNAFFTAVAGRWSPSGRLGPMAYVGIILWMGCTLFAAQGCLRGDDRAIIAFYLLGRLVSVMGFCIQVCHPPPFGMELEQSTRLRGMLRSTFLIFLLIEALPLCLAGLLCEDTGNASYAAFVLIALVPVLVLASRARRACRNDSGGLVSSSAAGLVIDDFEAMQERYELIVLVLSGLVLWALLIPGEYRVSLFCMLCAVGVFLLYFVARPLDLTPAYLVSDGRGMLAQHLHILVFGALPLLTVAYTRMTTAGAEELLIRGLSGGVDGNGRPRSNDAYPSWFERTLFGTPDRQEMAEPVDDEGTRVAPTDKNQTPLAPLYAPNPGPPIKGEASAPLAPAPGQQGAPAMHALQHLHRLSSDEALILGHARGLADADASDLDMMRTTIVLLCLASALFLLASATIMALNPDVTPPSCRISLCCRISIRCTFGGATLLLLFCSSEWSMWPSVWVVPLFLVLSALIESWGCSKKSVEQAS